MAKAKPRRAAFGVDQLALRLEAPALPRHEGELAGLGRFVSSGVGRVLKDDARSREEIAGAMSALLGETVSKLMLDAYASEAREDFSISVARFLALVVATQRYDVLDAVARRAGAAVFVGPEVETARLGHLLAQRRQLDAEISAVRSRAEPMARAARA